MRASHVFEESWVVPAPPERVRDVVVDLAAYPSWWPQVRAVAALGDDEAWVVCRSLLPYHLHLVLEARSRELPVLEVGLRGDLAGWVRWRLEAVPTGTRMSYRQEVDALGLLAWGSRVARPVLRANHAWMMRGCRRGLTKLLGG